MEAAAPGSSVQYWVLEIGNNASTSCCQDTSQSNAVEVFASVDNFRAQSFLKLSLLYLESIFSHQIGKAVYFQSNPETPTCESKFVGPGGFEDLPQAC